MLTQVGGTAFVVPSRLLVVAPHPDDETLGCGGLIASTLAQGGDVHTLFVTDGGASHPPSDLWPRERLARRREEEASEALLRLGLGDRARTFLRLMDAAMPAAGSPPWETALAQVVATVTSFEPDLVVLPWRRDPHCDHRAAFTLASAAIGAAGMAGVARLEYAIWLDELGAPSDFPREGEVEVVELDIADHLRTKEWAAQAHATQLGSIADEAPGGFCLTAATLSRLLTPRERYYRPCA